jgi:hypothetical protein
MIKYESIHSPEKALACDLCRKTYSHIIHIGTSFDTFLFCKNCLLEMAEKI